MSPFAARPQKRAKCPSLVVPTAFFVSRRLNKVKFCALSQASLTRSVLTCSLLLCAQFICLNIHIRQHVTVKMSTVTSPFQDVFLPYYNSDLSFMENRCMLCSVLFLILRNHLNRFCAIEVLALSKNETRLFQPNDHLNWFCAPFYFTRLFLHFS